VNFVRFVASSVRRSTRSRMVTCAATCSRGAEFHCQG
jgi:hypothetical protein